MSSFYLAWIFFQFKTITPCPNARGPAKKPVPISKCKGQLLKLGNHFSRKMPKIANPPSACWFLPSPPYPYKSICIAMIQIQNPLANIKKWTLPSPLSVTSSPSSPGVAHAQTQGQKWNPKGRERVGLLFWWHFQLKVLTTCSFSELSTITSDPWFLPGFERCCWR